MSNYPFDTFPLTKRIGIVNPVANLDARYGPWPTFNDALTGFSSLVRQQGLTVAVSGAGGITEYWYKDGITDNDLILKIPGGGITGDFLPLSGGTITGNLTVTGILSSPNIRSSDTLLIKSNYSPTLSSYNQVYIDPNFNYPNYSAAIKFDSFREFTPGVFDNPFTSIIAQKNPPPGASYPGIDFYFAAYGIGITDPGVTIEEGKLTVHTPSRTYLKGNLYQDYNQPSSTILRSSNDYTLGNIILSSVKLDVQSPVDIQNNIKIEGTYSSLKTKPQGSLVFQDLFTETVAGRELNQHTPNIGLSWTKIFNNSIVAKYEIVSFQNRIYPLFTLPSVGAIYRADINSFTNPNYEVKVFCNILSSPNPPDTAVTWLLARVQDANNFYALRFGTQENDWAIYKKVGGTFTLLKQLKNNTTSGFNFYVSLRVYNNVISVFISDVYVDSVIDSDISLAGLAGIGAGNIGVRSSDSTGSTTRLSEFTVTPYTELERHSYINENNFGIGTKTPNEKLTVVGNISSTNIIYSNQGNSQQWSSAHTTFQNLSSNIILDGGNTKGANLTVGTNDSFNLIFETNNLPRLTITNTGNVGINIANPSDRLEVDGTVKITGTFPSIRTTTNRFTVNETGSLPGDTGMVTQFSSGPYGRSIFAITHTGVNTAFFGLNGQQFTIGSEGDTDIRFRKGMIYTSTDILNTGTEIMRIKASTNSVGIGTSDPNERLTVVGNISSTGLVNATNTSLRVLELPRNLPTNTSYNISGSAASVYTQTVSADQNYSVGLGPGQTVYLYIFGNHETLKRHRVLFADPSIYQFYIAGAGQSNYFYTFKNHVTKVTLTNPLSSITPAPRIMGVGTAEVIRTDLNQNQGGLGFINLEQTTGPTDFLLQENGARLVIRNFT
jgi:hypothetical protein